MGVSLTDISILVRGQSNAAIFMQDRAAEAMRLEVQNDLGFDGNSDHVILLGDRLRSMWPGVPFLLPIPRRFDEAPWLTGFPGPNWGVGGREQIFLDYLAALPAPIRHAPILTLWMHNESDTFAFGLTAQAWAQAVRYDASLVRRVLAQQPATTPYLFIWVPANYMPENSPPPALDHPAQTIKQGMALLAADPGFVALTGPQTGDLDMSGDDGVKGGLHLSKMDAATLVHRLANCAANALAAYAKPGAPAGRLDCTGPVAIHAWQAALTPDVVHIRLSRPHILAPLSDAAAHGAGWCAISPAYPYGLAPISVSIDSLDDLALRFPQKIDASARIFYGYGAGRIALNFGAGHGAAVYDNNQTPLTASPNGLPIAAAP